MTLNNLIMNTEVIVIGAVVIVFGFIIYKSFFTKKVIPPSTGVGGGSGIENSNHSDHLDEGVITELEEQQGRE